MKKILSLFLAMLLLISGIPVAHATQELTFTKPYLLTLSPSTEMNVCWLTPFSSAAKIEYGETSQLGQTVPAKEYTINGMKTSSSKETYSAWDADPEANKEINVYQQIVTLSRLKPNTTYFYRTVTTANGQTETGKTYHFKTAPENGEDFDFVLLSDIQLKQESPATVKQAGQKKPDFIIYAGDFVNAPWKSAEWFPVKDCYVADGEQGKSWFEIMQQDEDGAELLQYAPIFPTPGNHEINDQRVFTQKDYASDWDNWSMSIYMQLFRPLYSKQEYTYGGEHWYSTDYGDLHISSIDVFRVGIWDGYEAPGWNLFDDISSDSKQIKWLENDLKNTKAKYKWVVMHWHMMNKGDDTQIPLSNPQPDPKDSSKVTYPQGDLGINVLMPLFEKYGVNAVNFGHSHVYERYQVNGVNYIEAASIGNNYRVDGAPLHPSGIAPIAEFNDFRSFMHVTKNAAGLTASGIQASKPDGINSQIGSIFDRFDIAKAPENNKPSASGNDKNVIMMIPDGQSLDALSLARWYQGGTPLALDEMACGLVRTYSSDSAITDSAPASTAFATGYKSHTGFIGVLPDIANMPGLNPIAKGDERKPVANVLEAAQLAGKSTGMVATSEIMHATPAGYSSHVVSRKDYDSISEQQVYQGLDVVLGSGSLYFSKEGRGDGEDMIAEIKNLGYDYFTSVDAFQSTSSDKLFGMFAPKDLSYEFDRNPAEQPSIAEMTKKAIDTLNRNENGFFLLIEGSKVDWAAHANDPIGLISDTLAYDDAVKVALDFAKKDGNTVVISVSDHGNGGVSIGNQNTTSTYDKTHIDEYIRPLKKATKTGEGIEKLFHSDFSNVREVMSQYYGIDDLTEEEITAIQNTPAGTMNYTVGPMISRRANIGWTTGGHTGEEVPLFVYAPNGLGITGVLDNTDIAHYVERILGVNLASASKQLFVPVRNAMEAAGGTVGWDASDEKNPVVTATKGDTLISIPINKNIAYVNGEKKQLSGVVIYNGITTYVPQDAIDLLQ